MIDLGLLQVQVRDLPTPRRSDADRIDLLRGLEQLTCIAEAAQAALTADLAESQESKAADAGVPAARRARGIASQVALDGSHPTKPSDTSGSPRSCPPSSRTRGPRSEPDASPSGARR